jgi:hypothetical protein
LICDGAGSGAPSPLFWCSILFKKLMGTAVLNVSTSPARHGVRAYAHTSSTPLSHRLGGPGQGERGVTLMLLNLNAERTAVSFRFAASSGPSPSGPSCRTAATARKYTIEAGPESPAGSSILLNGKLLEFASDRATTLPNLAGVSVRCDVAKLPAHSVTWLVVH